jgi:hypothetical protein
VGGSEDPAPFIKRGLRAAEFLKGRYGFDDTGLRVVFRLADSVRIRGQEPEKARQGLDWVLETVGELEAKGASYPFIRAQARFYRAILRDREFDRAELDLAYREYTEAAQKDRAQMLRALTYAGRCACTIGKLFDDPERIAKGKEILAAIPSVAAQENLILDEYLRNEIRTIDSACER